MQLAIRRIADNCQKKEVSQMWVVNTSYYGGVRLFADQLWLGGIAQFE